ncbi:uncharacterized protein [Dermacentor andersoni]
MGIRGLFLAGVISASISTISSIVNSHAAVLYVDIVSPYIKIPEKRSSCDGSSGGRKRYHYDPHRTAGPLHRISCKVLHRPLCRGVWAFRGNNYPGHLFPMGERKGHCDSCAGRLPAPNMADCRPVRVKGGSSSDDLQRGPVSRQHHPGPQRNPALRSHGQPRRLRPVPPVRLLVLPVRHVPDGAHRVGTQRRDSPGQRQPREEHEPVESCSLEVLGLDRTASAPEKGAAAGHSQRRGHQGVSLRDTASAIKRRRHRPLVQACHQERSTRDV